MATHLPPPFIPQPITRSSSDQGPRKAWWTPLFGCSPDPAYLDSANTNTNLEFHRETAERTSLRSVQFTEEKARLLRRMTVDAGSSHHEMYHSAIAARMASDFGVQSDP